MDDRFPLALKEGTVLAGQYIIEKVLGQGGFGITYRAKDHKNDSLVAIKEFFPDTMATREGTTVIPFTGERTEAYEYGKNCFLQEAKTLAQFINTDGIVSIHTYFEENATAYFVMEYVEGESLEEYIKRNGNKLSYEETQKLLLPVMEALSAVHEKGIVHRDVTPDNIFICKDGKVKLLDFGAARYSIGDKSKSLDVVLKHGFAPKEQYTRHGRQGAFTDVYSLGATFYYAITGKKLPDSIDRLEEDDMIPPSTLGVNIPEEKEEVLFKAISVQPQDRFQTMREFINALNGQKIESIGKTVAVNPSIAANNQPAIAGSSDVQPIASQAADSFPKAKKNFILPAIIIGGSVIVAALVLGIIFLNTGSKKNSDLDDPDDDIELVKDDEEDDDSSKRKSKKEAAPEPTEEPVLEYLESIENIGYFGAQEISNINNCGIVADSDAGTFVYVPGQGLCLYTRDSYGTENYELYVESPDDITFNINVIGDKVFYTKNCVPYLMNIDGSGNGRCTDFAEDVYVRRLYANENGGFVEQVGDDNVTYPYDYLYYQDWETGRTTPPIQIRKDSDIAIFENEVIYIAPEGEMYRCIYSGLKQVSLFDNPAIKEVFDISQSEMGENESFYFTTVSEGKDQYDYFMSSYFWRAEDYDESFIWNGSTYTECLGINKSTSYNINNFYSAANAYYNNQFFYEIENNEPGVDYHENHFVEIFSTMAPNRDSRERYNPNLFLGIVDPPVDGYALCFSPKYRKYYYYYFRDNGNVMLVGNIDTPSEDVKYYAQQPTPSQEAQ